MIPRVLRALSGTQPERFSLLNAAILAFCSISLACLNVIRAFVSSRVRDASRIDSLKRKKRREKERGSRDVWRPADTNINDALAFSQTVMNCVMQFRLVISSRPGHGRSCLFISCRNRARAVGLATLSSFPPIAFCLDAHAL